jgi:hypothetical protein
MPFAVFLCIYRSVPLSNVLIFFGSGVVFVFFPFGSPPPLQPYPPPAAAVDISNYYFKENIF